MPTSTESDKITHSLSSGEVEDACPTWAIELIQKVYVLEVEAGNLANPATNQWNTRTQEELLKVADRLDTSAGSEIGDDVEALFNRICRGLLAEKFTPEAIAEMINVRIPTGSRLKYCSASEVLGSD